MNKSFRVSGVTVEYQGTPICVKCAKEASCHLGPTSVCSLFKPIEKFAFPTEA